eukprot:gene1223-743_t
MGQTTDEERRDTAVAENFGFPFEPYSIQKQLMTHIYETLARKRSGVFESPTGTGKSLSLLCSALKWYQDYHIDVLVEKDSDLCASSNEASDIELPDWVKEVSQKTKLDSAKALLKQREQTKDDRKKRVMLMTSGVEHLTNNPFFGMTQGPSKRRATNSTLALDCKLDEDLVLEDNATANLPAIPTLADVLDERPGNDETEKRLQIIICSRTHSQLAQLLGELRKVEKTLGKALNVVTVGSRQQLCVNPMVQQRAKSGSHLTDLCRHLCDRGGGCSYKKNADRVTDLVLSDIYDLEETCENAKIGGVEGCAYFGVRRAIPQADVLLVPYNLIVNEEMREATGVQVEGNVLVIDEAHNLLDAINDSYGARLSLAQVKCTYDQLNLYRETYQRKLAPKNLLSLKQLTAVCAKLNSFLQKCIAGDGDYKAQAIKIGAFLVKTNSDHMDFHELLNFVERTQLLRKLRGFADKTAVQQQDKLVRKTEEGLEDRQISFAAASNGGYAVAEFLRLLASASTDDRVLVNPPEKGRGDMPPELHPTLQFLNLNAEKRFEKVVGSARSVILAGGTMEPSSEFFPLFKSLDKPPVRFSGGHVVPRDNVFARAVSVSSGVNLDFKHGNRSQPHILQALSKLVVDVASCTPGGTVLFVASFDYLAQWSAFLEKNGWKQKLQQAGVDFYADKRGASSSDFLSEFEKSCEVGKALMLSVVGGKLSEGINFSNRMCRCVGIVGLPYPNPSDLRLQEKMKFLDATSSGSTTTPNTPLGLTGRDYYKACCMKAVNQSVGRAIRHIKDWSAILLIDQRYNQPTIQQSVSGWLRPSIQPATHPNLLPELKKFYEQPRRLATRAYGAAPAARTASRIADNDPHFQQFPVRQENQNYVRVADQDALRDVLDRFEARSHSSMVRALEELGEIGVPLLESDVPHANRLLKLLVGKINYLTPPELCGLVDTLLRVQELNHGRLDIDSRMWTGPLADNLLESMHHLNLAQLVATAYKASALLNLPLGQYFYWALAERARVWVNSDDSIDASVVVAVMHHFAHAALRDHAAPMARQLTPRLEKAVHDGELKPGEMVNLLQVYSELPGYTVLGRQLVAALNPSLSDPEKLSDEQVVALAQCRLGLSEKSGSAEVPAALQARLAQMEFNVNDAAACTLALGPHWLASVPPAQEALRVGCDDLPSDQRALLFRALAADDSTVTTHAETLQILETSLLSQWIHLPTRLVGHVAPTLLRAAVHKETYSRLYESVTNIFVEASPATFAETVHVLAQAGTLITPSVFVRYNVESRVADFPPNSVPLLAWSMAVADVTNQSLWVSVISLLSAAENLTENQLCLAYEAACYAATMGLIEDTTLDAGSGSSSNTAPPLKKLESLEFGGEMLEFDRRRCASASALEGISDFAISFFMSDTPKFLRRRNSNWTNWSPNALEDQRAGSRLRSAALYERNQGVGRLKERASMSSRPIRQAPSRTRTEGDTFQNMRTPPLKKLGSLELAETHLQDIVPLGSQNLVGQLLGAWPIHIYVYVRVIYEEVGASEIMTESASEGKRLQVAARRLRPGGLSVQGPPAYENCCPIVANVLPWYAEGRKAWGRRAAETANDLNRCPAGVSYDQMFAHLIITVQKDFKIAGLYSFPYMLLADAILVDPVTSAPNHKVTGERLGSATLRYRLAQHLGYSVLTLPESVWTKLNDVPQKERLPAAGDKLERWLSQLRARRQEALQTASTQEAQKELKKSERIEKAEDSTKIETKPAHNNISSDEKGQRTGNPQRGRPVNLPPSQPTPRQSEWKEPMPPIQRRQMQAQRQQQQKESQQKQRHEAQQKQSQESQPMPNLSFMQETESNTEKADTEETDTTRVGFSWAQDLANCIDTSSTTTQKENSPSEGIPKVELPTPQPRERVRQTLDEEV